MLLKEKGHNVYPVHQRIEEIDGSPVYAFIRDITDPIDTVSLYVAADISSSIGEVRNFLVPGRKMSILDKKRRKQGFVR